jgi:adenylate kinase
MNANDTIIIMGRSGSGKGTQINLLKEYLAQQQPTFNIFHFESGSHFRNFIKAEGYTSELMRGIISEGVLAPDFITEWLLSDSFVKNMTKEDQILILDGFPRTLNQAYTLDSAMDYYKRTNIKVIHIDVSENEVRRRMLERGRKDDVDIDAIENRIEWYNKNVIPTIEYFDTQEQYNVHHINGEQTIEEVHQDIIRTVNN